MSIDLFRREDDTRPVVYPPQEEELEEPMKLTPVSRNMRDYVKIYQLMDKKKCTQIIEELDEIAEYTQHTFYDVNTDTSINRSGNKELYISSSFIPSRQYVMEVIYKSIQNYMDDLKFPWFATWQGFTMVRWNKYYTNTLMAQHCDHIHSIFDGVRKGIPTLTVLGQLNEDYEGGELVLFNDEVITLKTGELIVFPSNFLFPHRVDEVTKGTRHSFVSWVW